MSLWNIIKNLPSRITINDTISNAKNTRDNIISNLIPNITTVANALPNPESKYVTDLVGRFENYDRKKFKETNFFYIVKNAANNMVEYLNFICKHPHTFSEVETTQGISLDKATHLKLINMTRYLAAKLPGIINFAITQELILASEKARSKNKHATVYTLKDLYDAPKIISKINADLDASIPALVVFSNELKDIQATLSKLPKDVILNELTEDTLGHAHNLDPLGLNGFIPFDISINLNPFYYIGSIKAKWDNYVYESTKDEYQLVALKLIELQSLAEYGGNAGTEKQIKYYQDKAKRLQVEIMQYEEEHSGEY